MAYVLIVQGYCHGSRKDRGNKYTASDGLGVLVESPKTGPNRNTLGRGWSKGDRLNIAISLHGALGTYIHGTQRSDLIRQIYVPNYTIQYLSRIFSLLPFNQLSKLPYSNYNYIHIYIRQFYRTYLKISWSVELTLRRVWNRFLPASYRSSCRSIVAVDKINLLIHVLRVVNFTSTVSPLSVSCRPNLYISVLYLFFGYLSSLFVQVRETVSMYVELNTPVCVRKKGNLYPWCLLEIGQERK